MNATWSFRVGIALDEQLGIYVVKSIAKSGENFDYADCDYIIVISESYGQYGSTSDFRGAVKEEQAVKFVGDPDTGIATVEFYDPSAISGGTIENYVDEYTIATLPVLLPTPKQEGKVFVGWALSDSSTETFTSLPAGTMGDVTLYAVFEDANA